MYSQNLNTVPTDIKRSHLLMKDVLRAVGNKKKIKNLKLFKSLCSANGDKQSEHHSSFPLTPQKGLSLKNEGKKTTLINLFFNLKGRKFIQDDKSGSKVTLDETKISTSYYTTSSNTDNNPKGFFNQFSRFINNTKEHLDYSSMSYLTNTSSENILMMKKRNNNKHNDKSNRYLAKGRNYIYKQKLSKLKKIKGIDTIKSYISSKKRTRKSNSQDTNNSLFEISNIRSCTDKIPHICSHNINYSKLNNESRKKNIHMVTSSEKIVSRNILIRYLKSKYHILNLLKPTVKKNNTDQNIKLTTNCFTHFGPHLRNVNIFVKNDKHHVIENNEITIKKSKEKIQTDKIIDLLTRIEQKKGNKNKKNQGSNKACPFNNCNRHRARRQDLKESEHYNKRIPLWQDLSNNIHKNILEGEVANKICISNKCLRNLSNSNIQNSDKCQKYARHSLRYHESNANCNCEDLPFNQSSLKPYNYDKNNKNSNNDLCDRILKDHECTCSKIDSYSHNSDTNINTDMKELEKYFSNSILEKTIDYVDKWLEDIEKKPIKKSKLRICKELLNRLKSPKPKFLDEQMKIRIFKDSCRPCELAKFKRPETKTKSSDITAPTSISLTSLKELPKKGITVKGLCIRLKHILKQQKLKQEGSYTSYATDETLGKGPQQKLYDDKKGFLKPTKSTSSYTYDYESGESIKPTPVATEKPKLPDLKSKYIITPKIDKHQYKYTLEKLHSKVSENLKIKLKKESVKIPTSTSSYSYDSKSSETSQPRQMLTKAKKPKDLKTKRVSSYKTDKKIQKSSPDAIKDQSKTMTTQEKLPSKKSKTELIKKSLNPQESSSLYSYEYESNESKIPKTVATKSQKTQDINTKVYSPSKFDFKREKYKPNVIKSSKQILSTKNKLTSEKPKTKSIPKTLKPQESTSSYSYDYDSSEPIKHSPVHIKKIKSQDSKQEVFIPLELNEKKTKHRLDNIASKKSFPTQFKKFQASQKKSETNDEFQPALSKIPTISTKEISLDKSKELKKSYSYDHEISKIKKSTPVTIKAKQSLHGKEIFQKPFQSDKNFRKSILTKSLPTKMEIISEKPTEKSAKEHLKTEELTSSYSNGFKSSGNKKLTSGVTKAQKPINKQKLPFEADKETKKPKPQLIKRQTPEIKESQPKFIKGNLIRPSTFDKERDKSKSSAFKESSKTTSLKETMKFMKKISKPPKISSSYTYDSESSKPIQSKPLRTQKEKLSRKKPSFIYIRGFESSKKGNLELLGDNQPSSGIVKSKLSKPIISDKHLEKPKFNKSKISRKSLFGIKPSSSGKLTSKSQHSKSSSSYSYSSESSESAKPSVTVIQSPQSSGFKKKPKSDKPLHPNKKKVNKINYNSKPLNKLEKFKEKPKSTRPNTKFDEKIIKPSKTSSSYTYDSESSTSLKSPSSHTKIPKISLSKDTTIKSGTTKDKTKKDISKADKSKIKYSLGEKTLKSPNTDSFSTYGSKNIKFAKTKPVTKPSQSKLGQEKPELGTVLSPKKYERKNYRAKSKQLRTDKPKTDQSKVKIGKIKIKPSESSLSYSYDSQSSESSKAKRFSAKIPKTNIAENKSKSVKLLKTGKSGKKVKPLKPIQVKTKKQTPKAKISNIPFKLEKRSVNQNKNSSSYSYDSDSSKSIEKSPTTKSLRRSVIKQKPKSNKLFKSLQFKNKIRQNKSDQPTNLNQTKVKPKLDKFKIAKSETSSPYTYDSESSSSAISIPLRTKTVKTNLPKDKNKSKISSKSPSREFKPPLAKMKDELTGKRTKKLDVSKIPFKDNRKESKSKRFSTKKGNKKLKPPMSSSSYSYDSKSTEPNKPYLHKKQNKERSSKESLKPSKLIKNRKQKINEAVDKTINHKFTKPKPISSEIKENANLGKLKSEKYKITSKLAREKVQSQKATLSSSPSSTSTTKFSKESAKASMLSSTKPKNKYTKPLTRKSLLKQKKNVRKIKQFDNTKLLETKASKSSLRKEKMTKVKHAKPIKSSSSYSSSKSVKPKHKTKTFKSKKSIPKKTLDKIKPKIKDKNKYKKTSLSSDASSSGKSVKSKGKTSKGSNLNNLKRKTSILQKKAKLVTDKPVKQRKSKLKTEKSIMKPKTRKPLVTKSRISSSSGKLSREKRTSEAGGGDRKRPKKTSSSSSYSSSSLGSKISSRIFLKGLEAGDIPRKKKHSKKQRNPIKHKKWGKRQTIHVNQALAQLAIKFPMLKCLENLNKSPSRKQIVDDFKCNYILLYKLSLRPIPCRHVYHHCPVCFPFCISLRFYLKTLITCLFFMISCVTWVPCIICTILGRKLYCCVLCGECNEC